MAELDPSLILQAYNTNDPTRMMNMQQLAMQLKAKQQEVQNQNAVRQMMQQPGAVDENGLPSRNTLATLSRRDPEQAMQMASQRATIDLRNQEAGDKHKEDLRKIFTDETLAAVSVRQQAKDRGLSDAAADEAMQRAWSENWEDRKRTGGLADADMPHQTRPSFEFLQTKAMEDPGYRAEQAGLRQERGLADREREASVRDTRADARAAAGQEKFANPVEVEIDDGKGGTRQTLAQQNKTNGQWVTADENRTPIPTNANMRIIKEAASAGGRENIMNQRMLVDAKDVSSELKNITELPVTASGGWFGPRGQTHGIMSATSDVLANEVTPQDVQSFNTSMIGMGRALAGMETGGMQVNAELLRQFEGLKIIPGDTQFTRLQKLATMRQQAENALEGMMASPRLGKKQQELAQKLIGDMKTAIPFSVSDVLRLMNSRNPQDTLGGMARRTLQPTTAQPDGWKIEKVQ